MAAITPGQNQQQQQQPPHAEAFAPEDSSNLLQLRSRPHLANIISFTLCATSET